MTVLAKNNHGSLKNFEEKKAHDLTRSIDREIIEIGMIPNGRRNLISTPFLKGSNKPRTKT